MCSRVVLDEWRSQVKNEFNDNCRFHAVWWLLFLFILTRTIWTWLAGGFMIALFERWWPIIQLFLEINLLAINNSLHHKKFYCSLKYHTKSIFDNWWSENRHKRQWLASWSPPKSSGTLAKLFNFKNLYILGSQFSHNYCKWKKLSRSMNYQLLKNRFLKMIIIMFRFPTECTLCTHVKIRRYVDPHEWHLHHEIR